MILTMVLHPHYALFCHCSEFTVRVIEKRFYLFRKRRIAETPDIFKESVDESRRVHMQEFDQSGNRFAYAQTANKIVKLIGVRDVILAVYQFKILL